jgi:cell division septation protein DedD
MARRVRGPILAVLVTSGLLLFGARFIGRVAATRVAADRGGAAGSAQTAAAVPDLTFYSRLGDAPAAKGPSPESALRPAPGDLVPASGIFVVQVLGSADEAQAKRVRDRLASHGFPAAAIQDDGGTWKVRVGRWKERGPADAMADRIRKTIGLQTWVLREGER